MHLNKILEQIKRHQSPSEAIDKLSTALEKHEGMTMRLEAINILTLIVSQIKPCPVPAYLTCNPYGCNGGLNGYGYGYPYGYGDSCCA